MMLKGSEAVMQALRSEGVEYVFGLPGSSETQFMDSLEDHPELKYVLGLHESIAVSMAVGYARASGKVGIVNLHTYAGTSAAMNVLIDACRYGIPLIVTAGQGDTKMTVQEGMMFGDLVSLGKNFTKWSTEVTFAQNLALSLRRAFKVAMQPPTGPVFVSLPMNVMDEMVDFSYTGNLSSALSRRCADATSLDKVTDMLSTAQRPMAILGAGVTNHNAMSEVVELMELIGARVYVLPACSDLFYPTTHPQFLGTLEARGPERQRILDAADVTLVIGSPPPASARNVIQFDNDPWELCKNTPVALAIEGDIKVCVTEIANRLKRKVMPDYREAARSRIKAITKERETLRQQFFAEAQAHYGRNPVSAHFLGHELASSLPPHAVVVDQSWSYSPIMTQHLDMSEPTSYFRGRGLSIGQGLPLGIGVKLALPAQEVVALVGDGDAIWSCQSLWTAAHYNIPVKFVILDNASYRTVKQNKIRQMGEQVRGRYLGMDMDAPRIDFVALAASLGLRGQRVDKAAELGTVLKSVMGSNRPELIEVSTDGKV